MTKTTEAAEAANATEEALLEYELVLFTAHGGMMEAMRAAQADGMWVTAHTYHSGCVALELLAGGNGDRMRELRAGRVREADTAAPTATCERCEESFAYDNLADVDGERICIDCETAKQAEEYAADAAADRVDGASR